MKISQERLDHAAKAMSEKYNSPLVYSCCTSLSGQQGALPLGVAQRPRLDGCSPAFLLQWKRDVGSRALALLASSALPCHCPRLT